ncbi:MAG: aspartate carbamoyltransferase catalytic subunit [Alphaproteobacteria bacterium]|nr:aspartate carbamoyltransferase catalytic subunit [Alphaproteobacteria bacterium]MBV8548281.1 aspartate carbamoyltransferase catalytic subunit [Alphaproteobacteria bacterium]
MTVNPADDLIQTRASRDLSFLDLVSIDQVTDKDFSLIMDVARAFRRHGTYKFDFNKGLSLMNAFFESSTRTMASFDLCAKQLSMDTSNLSSSSSSTTKGESYLDTALTLDSYNLKIITVRTREAGVPEFLARHVNAGIISAGDGWHEHPTQGLLDALTMLDHFKSTTLEGRTVTIVGDILHSRVFGSLVRLLKKLKATVRVAAPETLLPVGVENFGLTVYHDADAAITGADVVYALRVQEERGAAGFIPTLREYSKMYGISKRRLDLAKPDAILMHPGPVRRDIDVHSALVAVDERSHILQQVENGAAVRKALLWLMTSRLNGKKKEIVRK